MVQKPALGLQNPAAPVWSESASTQRHGQGDEAGGEGVVLNSFFAKIGLNESIIARELPMKIKR
jgi:hypothetical protein